MKLHLLSDLHLEFWKENFPAAIRRMDTVVLPPLPDDAATVLVIAGDFCTVKRRNMMEAILRHLATRFHDIVYIPGNHEAYGSDLLMAALDIADLATVIPHIHYGGSPYEIKGRRFHTCTLWTDFDGGDPVTLYNAGKGMNDYRLIRYGDRLLRPEDVGSMHHIMREKLEENLQPGDIVITHHAPSFRSIHPDYAGHALNGCYASNLEDLILDKNPALWLHGHVHYGHDYLIGNTRVICNPVGYLGEPPTGYKNDTIIEI